MKAIKGRWGWHPCDYQTYLKLKKIKKWYWESIYAEAKHRRWERKLPKNRKGVEPPKPCPFIGDRKWNSKTKEKDEYLLELFERARMPKLSESEVSPFEQHRIDLINEVFDKLERWHSSSSLDTPTTRC